MNTQDNDLSALTTYLPLLSVSAFIFGTICLGTYYSFFQFNIFEYVDISELLPLVVKDSLVFFFMALPFGVVIYRSPKINSDTLAERKDRNSPKYIPWPLRNWSIIIGLGWIVMSGWDIWEHKLDFTGGLLAIDLIAMMILIRKMPQLIVKLTKADVGSISLRNFTLIGQLTILLILGAIFNGIRDHLVVEDPKVREKITVLINSKPIKSTDDHYYIGKTRSEVFFFDKKNQQVDIYPVAIISQMIYDTH